MKTQTKFFGELEYAAEDGLTFPAGLPGFEQLENWLLLRPEGWEPLGFLQSLEETETCFVVLPVESVERDYELAVMEEDLARLGYALAERAELSSWAILTIGEKAGATANLAAPVVIAPATRRGVQAVRDDRRYSAVQVLENPGARPEACS